jgi:N-acetylmuramoyl-L-alanine amidase
MLHLLLIPSLLLSPLPLASAAVPPTPEPNPALSVPPPAAWPADAAALEAQQPPEPGGALALEITIDPGHGVGSNSGNDSCLCIEEQDHNLRVATHLAASLEAQGLHRVRLSRRDNAGPGYQGRIDAAAAAGSQVFISLHSDARGEQHSWAPHEGRSCSWNDANPGFSVLYSDEGSEALVAERLALARAVAARLARAGFLPYDGHEYHQLYQGDPQQPGVFVDRHIPSKRIRMLRRPPMPSVIIETHNAWDRREEPRWQLDATLEAFDAAVIAALGDWSPSSESESESESE